MGCNSKLFIEHNFADESARTHDTWMTIRIANYTYIVEIWMIQWIHKGIWYIGKAEHWTISRLNEIFVSTFRIILWTKKPVSQQYNTWRYKSNLHSMAYMMTHFLQRAFDDHGRMKLRINNTAMKEGHTQWINIFGIQLILKYNCVKHLHVSQEYIIWRGWIWSLSKAWT